MKQKRKNANEDFKKKFRGKTETHNHPCAVSKKTFDEGVNDSTKKGGENAHKNL